MEEFPKGAMKHKLWWFEIDLFTKVFKEIVQQFHVTRSQDEWYEPGFFQATSRTILVLLMYGSKCSTITLCL